MGNVAGVGQFLEAVGGPGPQLATQTGTQAGATDNSSRGQDFATALQEAGGPGAAESHAVGKGQVDAETGAGKASGTAAGAVISSTPAAAKSEQGKAAGVAKAGVAGQPILQGAIGGQLPGKTVGTATAVTLLSGGKPAQTAAEQSSEVASASEGFSPLKTGTETAPTMSLSGTPNSKIANSENAKGQSAGALLPDAVKHGDLAGTVPLLAVKSSSVSSTNAKRAEEVTAGEGKPAEKTVVGNSKPAATGSQGVVAAAQVMELAVATAPVVVPTAGTTPQYVADAAREGAVVAAAATMSAVAAAAVAATASVAASRMAGTQVNDGKASDKAMGDAMNAASAGTKTARGLADVKLYAGQGEPAGLAAGVMTEKVAAAGTGPTLGVDASKAGAGAVSAGPVQVGSAVAGESLETVRPALQGASQTTGIAGVAAVKTASHGGITPTAEKAVDGAGTASVETGKAGPAVAAAKAPGVGTVPVASGPSGLKTTARAGAADPKTAVTTAPVQGAPVVAKAAGSTREPVPAVAAAKAPEGAGHVAAAQPAAVAVEPVSGIVGIVGIAGSMPVAAAHEVAGGAAAVGGTTGVAGVSSASSGVAGTEEAAGGSGLSHTTLSSTPTSLEVGVSSGTHGWLKIRAELNAAGTVDASLTGTSAASAERLRTELPGLNNFLLNERVAMGSLDVRSAAHAVAATGESSATFSQAGSGQGHAGQGGNATGSTVSADAGSAGGRAQQQAAQSGDSVPVVNGVGAVDEVVLGRASDAAMYASSMELDDNAAASSVGYGAGGGWLNVRA